MNAKNIIDKWLNYVNEKQVEPLLALYNDEAIVIPTFSNRILNSPEKIKDYFVKLASREEISIAMHNNTLIEQNMNNNLYSISGIYCWRFAVDGELLSFEARFSYLIDTNNARPILHHHSSQIPRMI